MRRVARGLVALGWLLLSAAPGLAQTAAGHPGTAPAAGPKPAPASADQATAHRASHPAAAAPSSCLTCHGSLEDALKAPTEHWATDVHAASGLGCESCHGGDPLPSLKEDSEGAMSAAKGFSAAPKRTQIAESCGRCHADAAYMKRYNPQMRVDQLAEYRTSVHGKRNAAGDTRPATCVDCHGAHGIRPVSSPDSPVYSLNVPATCARCHADATLMSSYGIPTTQYADYKRSVHGAALLERQDTAAPACNDCHGNHGAAPPGVQSVANVCGQCHGREAALFRASFKKDLFETMQASECTVCHDHHLIRPPTPELFHGGSAPTVSAGKITSTDPFAADLGDLVAGAKTETTWRAIFRSHVTAADPGWRHTVELTAEGLEPVVLDATLLPGALPTVPESRKITLPSVTAELEIAPLSGAPAEGGDAVRFTLRLQGAGPGLRRVRLRDRPGGALVPHLGSACLKCHTPGDSCDQASERMYASLLALDGDLRTASSLLRRAEVAGMEVSGPLFELKSKGTTGRVEARALIHSFDPDRLLKRAEEGKAVAAAALEAGNVAMAELQFRRKGLAVSLVLVGLVLAGLYLKIREVDRTRAGQATGA